MSHDSTLTSARAGRRASAWIAGPAVVSILGLLALGVGPQDGARARAADATLAADEEALPRVDTVVVGRAAIAASRQWDGVVQAVRQSTIAAQTQARIVRLDAQAGDRLRKGQVVAVLDARESAAGLAQADARVSQTQATLANARLVHERNERLHAQGFISKSALDASSAQLRVAEAAQREAGAGRTLQRVSGSYTTVVAPFDAVVSERLAELGEVAAPGKPLVTMYEPGRMRIAFFVPAPVAAAMADTATVRVRLPGPGGEARWSAPLAAQVMPAADPGSATVEIRADLETADARTLVPGQHLAVRTEGAHERVLAVPTGATLTRGELQLAYVAGEGGFVLRAVRLGRSANGRVEVLAGLREGERIALDPVRAGLRDARPGALR